MFFIIVRREFIGNLFSLRFTISIILCVLLMLISSYTLREKYERQLDEYDAAVATHHGSLKASNAIELMTMVYKIDKRPAILGMLATGLEGIGKNVTVNTSIEPSFENSDMSTEPLVALFGTLDFAFVTRVVISLLALLFTYDAIAGEREQGTLKMTLSNAIPRDLVILGKALGSYLSILLPFMASVLIFLIVILISPQVHFDRETWQRVFIIVFVSLLYIGVFTALGLFISARTESSTTALLSLLLIWTILVFAIPKASSLLAGQLYHVPSIQEIQAQKSSMERQLTSEFTQKMMKMNLLNMERIEGRYEQLEERYEQSQGKGMNEEEVMADIQTSSQKGVADFQKVLTDMMKEFQDEISLERDKIQSAYERKLRRQQEVAVYLSRVSPASSYIFAVVNLANTGIERQQTFLRDAKQYQKDYTDYIRMKSSKMGGFNIFTKHKEEIDLSDMPRFQPRDPTLDASLSAVWIDILLLFVIGIVFFMAAYISFLRYEL